jgi:hypothetical protein
MIEKIPIVTPKSDKTVLRRFDRKACQAKRRLSKVSLKNNILGDYIIIKVKIAKKKEFASSNFISDTKRLI